MIVLFAGNFWATYDFMHPKRTAVQYTYNVRFSRTIIADTFKHTNGAHTAHLAFLDRGTELDFVEAIHARYGAGPVEHTSLGEHDPDWDVLYPISSFLDTYRFPLPPTPFDWPNLRYTVNNTESSGVRRIQLSLDFVSNVKEILVLIFRPGSSGRHSHSTRRFLIGHSILTRRKAGNGIT